MSDVAENTQERDDFVKNLAMGSLTYHGDYIRHTYPTLKDYCKSIGYRCSQRRRGSRYYVTISDKHGADPSKWLEQYNTVVGLYYPKAYMTSGSMSGATFMIGDVMDLLKGGR